MGILTLALWLSGTAEPLLRGQSASPASAVLRVPATANPYLAGMPNGARAHLGDSAPRQSPVLVNLSLVDAIAVSFVASGGANHTPSCPPHCDPPDGSSILASHGSENGISDVTAPYDSLLGVFLDDTRPNETRAPRGLGFGSIGGDFLTLSPKLKQVFFIGAGTTRRGAVRRYLVPKGATKLYLGTMDGYDWNNNSGSFLVMAAIERSEVSSNLFTTDSTISYESWPCLPDRSRCTPGQERIETTGPGRYHVLLPPQIEWAVSIPTPANANVTVTTATGIVCLDLQLQGPSSCSGPYGRGAPADNGFLVADQPVGALVSKREGERTYFSVNDRSGAAFQHHDGYFEFDVVVREAP